MRRPPASLQRASWRSGGNISLLSLDAICYSIYFVVVIVIIIIIICLFIILEVWSKRTNNKNNITLKTTSMQHKQTRQ